MELNKLSGSTRAAAAAVPRADADDRAVATLHELVAGDVRARDVVRQKHAVPSDLVKLAVANGHVRAVDNLKGCAAVDAPITATGHLVLRANA